MYYQENNQTIPLEKYIQALRSVYKKQMRVGFLILLLIYGIAFVIIYILFNPSINFFIYVIVGIGIIMGLESFSNEDIIDKVEKKMHGYNLNEFKQLFRKIYKGQNIKDIKTYVPIYVVIMGVLTYIYFTYYPEDTWFIYILAMAGLSTLLGIISPYVFINEFFETIEKETETKAILL